MSRISLVFLLALFVATCGGSSNGAEGIEGTWQMSEGTVGGEKVPLLESHPITITFDGDEVSGTAACNLYQGTFEVDGSSIDFDDLVMTEMACLPAETMEAEQLYARGLTMVRTVTVDGDLVLTGPGVEMAFQPAEEQSR